MYICPICGDWDDNKDWCSSCNVPMKFKPLNNMSDLDEAIEYDAWCQEQYDLYIKDMLSEMKG